MIASLMTLSTLSACSTHPTLVDRPVGPPVALYSESTENAPEAPPRGSTNAVVVSYAQSLKNSLRACYDDRKGIRDWAAGLQLDQSQK